MTIAMFGEIGTSKQRGFRLRCFLGVASSILSVVCAAQLLNAQVDVPKAERLSHVDGLVVNDSGHPASGLEVTLVRDDKVAFQTRTDQSGGFGFTHLPSGPYLFRVKRSANAPAERQILVTDEVVTALERKKLYVILGPGACQDACSAVLTSKRDFDRAIRKMTKH